MTTQSEASQFELEALLSPEGAYTPARDTRELVARVLGAAFTAGAVAAAIYAVSADRWNVATVALLAVLAVGIAAAMRPVAPQRSDAQMLVLFWVSVVAIVLSAYAFDVVDILLLMLQPMMLVAYLFWRDRLILVSHMAAACLAFSLPFITGEFELGAAMLIVTLPTFVAVSVIAGTLADRFRHLRASERSRFKATIEALSTALTARDGYTGSHSHETLELVRSVCDELGLSEHEVEYVCDVALLHDIGKIGIPNEVLNAPGKLDARQWEIMKEHPVIGERIVATVPGLEDVARAIRHEHEHWNGCGYPDGLSAAAIPLASRIVLVCDAYHAMTSDRPYRRAMSDTDARLELSQHAGSQFDPQVVEALLRVLDPPTPSEVVVKTPAQVDEHLTPESVTTP
jgi:HD-GYP domain-containing protein (c-di-GMP phosphodiesterase class II)